ncbi:MAG: ligase-associated DNA damage response DEXH box helicase [Phycisphaerales bacterium]|nr:ligase-associated DNA damage response DEXH box helicase [Phycisphaerales bacterium]
MNAGIATIERWFAGRGWSPFSFQREAWAGYLEGKSGVVHAPTGTGKTLSVWLGPVIEWLEERGGEVAQEPPQIRVLWITPMRALAGDACASLLSPVSDLGLGWSVEARTGDTSQSVKSRQKTRLPTALVTTPESLSILLSYADSKSLFKTLRCVVMDEWHELLSTKRGVQAELGLARLRAWLPGLRTWGLSATLGNTVEAARALVGPLAPEPLLIKGAEPKRVEIRTLLPESLERFPWAGHVGTRLVDQVIAEIEGARTTLMFTNTRSQAEIWFRRLMDLRRDWIGRVGIHHGSLDKKQRKTVEDALRSGESPLGPFKCVVCTSSLDLGVDFRPVDRVIQVGSPKGIARLVQRAGRSGHSPGLTSVIVGVPTNAMELVEFSAARTALEAGEIESRRPLEKPLDLLVQHMVTVAAGGGFHPAALLQELRTTWAFRDLTDEEWAWAMSFVEHGGPALTAYDKYKRIAREAGDGMSGGPSGEHRCVVASPQIARLHRMGIGTITSDQAVQVRYASGKVLGQIEESFVTRLMPGDRFVFAGKVLELVRLRQMTAIVTPAKSKKGAVPRWNGGRMPLSTQLAHGVLARLAEAREGVYADLEMQTAMPLLELQKSVSRLPAPGELLIERVKTRVGWHVFFYPFAGRLAHEGLAPVVAWRLVRRSPLTVSATSNDYGLEILTETPLELDESLWRELLSPEDLVPDLLDALNATEMARRQFREIARVAGLTHTGYPGQRTPARHLQASSDMFFEVFEQFDPENRLLDQARREVLEGQLEIERLHAALDAIASCEMVFVEPPSLTPMSFPLYAERLRSTQASSEAWEDRVRKMAVELDGRAAR